MTYKKITQTEIKEAKEKMAKEVKFVAIDVETTGLSPLYNELIEVSAIKYEGANKIDTFSTLIKPVAYTHLTLQTNREVEESRGVVSLKKKKKNKHRRCGL